MGRFRRRYWGDHSPYTMPAYQSGYYVEIPPVDPYRSPSPVDVYPRAGFSPSPYLGAKDARRLHMMPILRHSPDWIDRDRALWGAPNRMGEEAAPAAPKRKRPFEAVSRVFTPAEPGGTSPAAQAVQKIQEIAPKVQALATGRLSQAEQAQQAQQALRQAQQALQETRTALVAPPPTTVVQQDRFTGAEMAITAGVAVAAFGLGIWIGRSLAR
jgi:hypothetical protein